MSITGFEGAAEEVTQIADHILRRLNISVHQRRYAVKCVEQKMRLNLHFQRVESGLGQPHLQLRGSYFTFLQLVHVKYAVGYERDNRVYEQISCQIAREVVPKGAQKAHRPMHPGIYPVLYGGAITGMQH